MSKQPNNVLFACNFNSVRSPIAEGIAKHFFGNMIHIDSAGVRQGNIDSFAVAVCAEINVDISQHKSKTFEDLDDTPFDLVISLTPEAQHKAVELTRTMAVELEYWPSMDPTGVYGNREIIIEAFREVRDQLLKRIEERFLTD